MQKRLSKRTGCRCSLLDLILHVRDEVKEMVGEYRGNRETHSDPYSFDDECKATNAFFGRNSGFNEIKAHHYIVSFAPEDVRDNGLTPEKAQVLGMGLAAKAFPGHQTIVCTHKDGHNGAGNIHCHIVINSVRKKSTALHPNQERRYKNYKSNNTKTNY